MAGGFAVTISAVDKLTGTLTNINRSAKQAFAPLRNLGASTRRLMDASGLTRVSGAIRDIGRSARDTFGRLSAIIAPLGAISGAASIAGMYRMVAAWSEWGTQLGNASRSIGVTAQALGNLQGAARLAGTSGSSLTAGLQTLGQTMYDAVGGRNANAVVMFNTLGVAFRKNATQARSVTDVLPQLADKIASLRDPYAQAQAASTLFGGAAADMLPFLRRGAAGIREYEGLAQRYLHITPQTTAAANRFREAQTRLTLSVEGLTNRISERLAPVIAPLLRQFADWIASSPQVQQGIDALGQGVQRFADWLRGVDWAGAERSVERWGGRIMWVTDLIGGPVAAIRDLMLLMAGRFALSMISPWVRLGWEIGKVSARLVALAVRAVPAAIAAIRGLRVEEEAEAAAENVAGGGRFGRLASLAGRASLAIGGGIAAHEALRAADPNDRMGAWIDDHVPGASWLDNAASRLGMGRSYREQARASGGTPRGIRNNNPGNLVFVGQAGARLESGVAAPRFAAFASMDQGIQALASQLGRYQDHGINTISSVISKYAPANENNTAAYIARLAGSMHVDPNAALNLRDPAVARQMIYGISSVENGGGRLSMNQIDHALQYGSAILPSPVQPSGPALQVNSVSGTAASTASVPAGGAQQTGRIDLHVHSDPGTTARVAGTSGSVADARVVHNNVTGVAP